MRYPVMLEAGDAATAWSVAFPDLPGCFSAGDTLDDAMAGAEEAAAAWIDAALDAGRAIPNPSSAEFAMNLGNYAGWAIGYLTIDGVTHPPA